VARPVTGQAGIGAQRGGAPGATRPPGHRYLLLSPGGATGSGGKYRVAHPAGA